MLALRDLMRPIGEHNVLQPACPICSRPLRLTRVTPRDGDLAELRTYGCTGCGVWLTEAADDTRQDSMRQESRSNGQANGQLNGQTNGHVNGHMNGHRSKDDRSH
jgi:hypothetical protein